MAFEINEIRSPALGGSLEGSHRIFVVIFIAFLLMALVSLLFGQNWRSLLPGAEGERSVLGGVKSAVYTVMSELV
jgi:light-harvesting complex 1 beta chain